jgi:uncharacterized membrane protein
MLWAILPFIGAAALLLLGLWMRWPTVGYNGPATQDAYNYFAFDRFAYSDIASLYFRDGLADHPRPYLDYPLEYPVGTGGLIYLLNSATGTMPQYFLLTSLVMAVAALCIAALVPRFPRGSLPLFALSPSLALYANLNWDMWGVLLTVAALLLFVRARNDLAATILAAAAWTKFFPILFLPFLVLDRLQRRGRRAAVRFAIVFVAASAAINIPVLLLTPSGWWYFFEFNAERGGELNNLWGFFDPSWLSTDEINRVNALLLLWGLVVLLILQRRTPPGAWLSACCAMLAWFFFLNKVYSPQYGLWIVAMLAVAGAATALAVGWSAIDLLYFGAQFVLLGLSQYGDAQVWFEGYAFVPAVALREGMLLVVIGWCIYQMGSQHPRGSPVAVTRVPGSAPP